MRFGLSVSRHAGQRNQNKTFFIGGPVDLRQGQGEGRDSPEPTPRMRGPFGAGRWRRNLKPPFLIGNPILVRKITWQCNAAPDRPILGPVETVEIGDIPKTVGTDIIHMVCRKKPDLEGQVSGAEGVQGFPRMKGEVEEAPYREQSIG